MKIIRYTGPKLFGVVTNAAGHHPGPGMPATADDAPYNLLKVKQMLYMANIKNYIWKLNMVRIIPIRQKIELA